MPRITPDPELFPPNRWRVLMVLAAALTIVVIDMTVLHVASPLIAEDLRPSASGLLWMIDIYPLVVAPLLIAASSLSDRFGRKRGLIAGLVIFTAASVMAGLATSPTMLIAARAIQGLGGALIMPGTMTLIRLVFPDREERIKAIGVWSAVLAGGAAAGPLLGGFLVEQFSWRAVFLINVPVLAVVLPFALWILPESRHSSPPPWDSISIAAVAAGILLVIFGIKDGARHGFLDPTAGASLAVGATALAVFVRRQRAATQPMLDVRLFARPALAVAVVAVVLVMFALVGLELYFAQYLQIVLDLEPLAASVRLLPLVAATLVGSVLASPIIKRFGSRNTLAAGFAIAAGSLVPFLWLGTRDQVLLLSLPFIALGLALQAALVAANDTILSSVTNDQAGQASAIEETAYELGGGIGVGVLGAIGAAVYTASIEMPAGLGAGAATTASATITDAGAAADRLGGSAGDALRAAADAAWLTGFHTVVVLAAAMIAIGALSSWLLVPRAARVVAPKR